MTRTSSGLSAGNDSTFDPHILQRVGADHWWARLDKEKRLTEDHVTFGYWTMPFRTVERVLSGAGALLRACGVWEAGLKHALEYRLRENRLIPARRSASFGGYRILHLSDLHVEGIADGGRSLRRLIRSVRADLCVLTGDFRYREKGDSGPAVRLTTEILEGSSFADGTYAVLGNHDSIHMVQAFESAGIRVLLNEGVGIRRGSAQLWLAGVDDPHYYRLHDMSKALAAAPADALRILLAHSPEAAQEAEQHGADIYLCGHAHGGQICLPGGRPIIANLKLPRKYFAGAWTHGRMLGYTSRGSGASGLPVRYFSHPEVTVHIIH